MRVKVRERRIVKSIGNRMEIRRVNDWMLLFGFGFIKYLWIMFDNKRLVSKEEFILRY